MNGLTNIPFRKCSLISIPIELTHLRYFLVIYTYCTVATCTTSKNTSFKKMKKIDTIYKIDNWRPSKLLGSISI
uniref:Uncharacterized protein n=1 Tax=Onchocerca volvulus TaxID=6282 RepID=A0A8R1TM80_ONCVO